MSIVLSRQSIALISISLLLTGVLLHTIPGPPPTNAGGVTTYDELDNWSDLRDWLRERPPRYKGTLPEETLIRYPPGEIYALLERNVSAVMNRSVGPETSTLVQITTNRFGLRDDGFTAEKPENTTRILVVGDSFTYGSGVNNSDRYTNILERKLNNNFSRRIEVLNAGIPAYGMKDYYLFLKHKGLSFSPDIIVVQILNNDRVSKSQSDPIDAKVNRRLRQYLQDGYSYEKAFRKSHEVKYNWIQEHLQGKPPRDTGLSYLYNISSLVPQDIPLLFYSADYMRPDFKDFFQEFRQETGSKAVFGPEEFTDDWRQYDRTGESELRISRFDPHPNVKGHRLLAEKLYPALAHTLQKNTTLTPEKKQNGLIASLQNLLSF